MSNLYTRISKRIKMTINGARNDCHFSARLACLRMADELGGRLGFKKLSKRARGNKNAWIMHYLERDLADMLATCGDQAGEGTYIPAAPIWVCWWTGEETAPELVKRCICSIRKNAGSHPVYLISEENYQDFLDIPDFILEKVKNKTMCIAHLSDYMRFSLLERYGGLWLDATIFCSRLIDEEYFALPVFTCKGTGEEGKYISDYRWTTFCFGGYRGNILFRYIRKALEVYWRHNEVAIDYLLLDYLINLGYQKNPAIRKLLDAVPPNNPRRDCLQAAMNAALPAEQFENVIHDDTLLYKLSWRESYALYTKDNEKSVYGYFLDRDGT